MPARKRKQQTKPKKPQTRSRPQNSDSQSAQKSASQLENRDNCNQEESKSRAASQFLDEEEYSALSTHEIKKMVDRTAEFADSLQFSSVGDLQSHMQNTISQMRGDKTVTDTTASVSNEGGGIGLQRNLRNDDDELGLSQLASAVNQISAASQSYQNSVITGHNGSNMMWIEDELAAENAQYLQKTQIYDTSLDKDREPNQSAMLSNFFESSALQYEKVNQGQAPSHDNTFIKEDNTGNTNEDQSHESDTTGNNQMKLLTPGLLQQLMLNSEQLLNQKIGRRHKEFAPFEFTESIMDNQTKIDLLIGAQFDEPSQHDGGDQPAPVLGLNLKEYFQKRHLVDQLPVEPLPPIENPLEMTQNHEDWVRGQEDFKINLEQLQNLHQPADKHGKHHQSMNANNIYSSELVADVFSSHEAQKELAALHENIKSVSSSFDIKSWAALTQKHNKHNSKKEKRGKATIEELQPLSQTQNEEQMQKLLHIESQHKHKNFSRGNKKQQSNSKSMIFSGPSKAFLEENRTDQGPSFLLQDLENEKNRGSQEQLMMTKTFVEHHAQSEQMEALSANVIAKEAFNALKQNIQSSAAQPHLLEQALESTISKVDVMSEDRINGDENSFNNLESFISQPELQQLLQLESSLFNLLQETSIAEFMVPNKQSEFQADDEYQSFTEPEAPQIGGSLKNLEDFLIRGDLRNCVLCNSKYTEGDVSHNVPANLPRVLYCGDSLCENCITRHIQRASITEKANRNVAACQVICPVCDLKHIFKLTKTGFLVCNDKYIKIQDEKGPVNFFPSSKINQSTFQLDKDTLHLNLMDNSISIPNSLIIRSLPINIELLELLKTTRRAWNRSQIEMSVIDKQSSSSTQKSQKRTKANSSVHRNKSQEANKEVPDLEQHMSAFNVEEFVREYEKEILQRLTTSHDEKFANVPVRDPREILLELSQQKKARKDQAVKANNQNSMHQGEQFQQHQQQTLSKDEQSQTITCSNKSRMASDLHGRFDGKRESSQEERARRNRKAPERKKFGQSFKSHQNAHHLSSAGSSNPTISAGNNANAQAIFKKKMTRKQRMHLRRDSSYGSSSSDDLIGRMQTLGRNGRGHTATLFEGVGATQVTEDLVSNNPADDVTVVISKGQDSQKLKQSISVKNNQQHRSSSMEKLIPVDLDLEQLDFTRQQKSMRCDRLSNGSDMSPEELISENSLKRVSMEMLQASQQVNLDGLPNEESAKFFMNSVLVKDPINGEITLQPLPEDQMTLERKKQMRQQQEERRREKKQISKAAEIEESKQKLIDAMTEYQRLDSIQTLIEEELKLGDTAKTVANSIQAQQNNSEPQTIPDYANFVSQLAQQEAEGLIAPFSFPVQTIQEDSASKKKARRNKKKRRKQQLMQQAQQLAELMNGHQISEDCESDLYTILVPVEETELEPDPMSSHGAVKFKYKLSTRNYFESEQLYEGDIGMINKASCLTSSAPDQSGPTDELSRLTVTCSSCSLVNYDQPLWFKSDQKVDDNGNFKVRNGQAEEFQTFQFNKAQLQVLKELVDLGLLNVATHYCEPCNVEAQEAEDKDAQLILGEGQQESSISVYKDVKKMCFCCTLQHRIDHASHNFVMLMPLQLLMTQLKKSQHLEYLARQKIGLIQQMTAQKHFANLQQVIQELVLDKSHVLYSAKEQSQDENPIQTQQQLAHENNAPDQQSTEEIKNTQK